MRKRTLRKSALVALTAAGALVLGALPASAATGGSSAYGAKAELGLLGQQAALLSATPVAKDTGPTHADLADAQLPGLLELEALSVNAKRNTSTGEVSSDATVGSVALPVLSGIANATPTAKAIKASCDATTDGITGTTTIASLDLGDLGDANVGKNIAPNTTLHLGLGDLNVATLILNEQIRNDDGSLTVNAFHLKLLGGALDNVASGDIILSSATCGPAAPPTPMASGAGLWIGLGLLGATGIPTGVVVLRKRRRTANGPAAA